jgi:hypothetical protein
MTPAAAGRYLVCLTGNIATGKSTVAAMLAELGVTVIDADKVVHEIMGQGSEVYDAIVAAFGPEIVGGDGEIRRGDLGRIVFSGLASYLPGAMGDDLPDRAADPKADGGARAQLRGGPAARKRAAAADGKDSAGRRGHRYRG